jgi:DNA polymerase I-like protein with 3'-5' exonuclease and polymerase domains
VPEDEAEDVAGVTRELMEGIVDLTVPLKVDVASGKTLADAKQ